MELSPGPEERYVEHTGRILLECKKCGERLVLLGLEEDWRSEQRTEFDCECGGRLTLTDRANEEALAIKRLLRGDGGRTDGV